MAREKLARRVIEGRESELIADLRLNQRLFGLRDPGLGIENKEDGLGAELVLALFGLEIFLRKVQCDFCGFDSEKRFLELMSCVGDSKRYVLPCEALLVLIAAATDQGISEIGFCGMILDRKIECEDEPISGEFEMKKLVEAVTQAAGHDELRRNRGGVELIAAQPVAGIIPGEPEIGLEAVVRQSDAHFIGSKLLA